MSEHSKGPELRYDDHYARIYDDATGMMLADLYRLNRHKSLQAATQELHVLGRKMAASPELVEVLLECLREDLAPYEETDRWIRARAEKVRAALKKAGVKP